MWIEKIYTFKTDHPEDTIEYQESKEQALFILKKEEKHTLKKLEKLKQKEVK